MRKKLNERRALKVKKRALKAAKKAEKKAHWKRINEHYNPERSRATVFTYYFLRIAVIVVLTIQAIHGNWSNVFTCGLTLVLFMVPSMLERRLKIDLPNTLEVIILLFIFAAEILGEIHSYYLVFPKWDDMLHTINGFLCAAIGFALIDILNESDKTKFDLSPMFVALVAFCFSMTVGVLWEFFEFSMDYWFGMDMQKDTWLAAFNTVALDPTHSNVAERLKISQVIINDQLWPAYLDIGLYDTMHDLWVNFLGAVTFSFLGLIYIKNRGKGLAAAFIPTMANWYKENIKKLEVSEFADEPLDDGSDEALKDDDV